MGGFLIAVGDWPRVVCGRDAQVAALTAEVVAWKARAEQAETAVEALRAEGERAQARARQLQGVVDTMMLRCRCVPASTSRLDEVVTRSVGGRLSVLDLARHAGDLVAEGWGGMGVILSLEDDTGRVPSRCAGAAKPLV